MLIEALVAKRALAHPLVEVLALLLTQIFLRTMQIDHFAAGLVSNGLARMFSQAIEFLN